MIDRHELRKRPGGNGFLLGFLFAVAMLMLSAAGPLSSGDVRLLPAPAGTGGAAGSAEQPLQPALGKRATYLVSFRADGATLLRQDSDGHGLVPLGAPDLLDVPLSRPAVVVLLGHPADGADCGYDACAPPALT